MEPRRPRDDAPGMSLIVWVMVGLAFWHFTVFVPDFFPGGIIGALVFAVGGAVASGYVLPEPGIPSTNPPGIGEAAWAVPGSLAAMAGAWLYGRWRGIEAVDL